MVELEHFVEHFPVLKRMKNVVKLKEINYALVVFWYGAPRTFTYEMKFGNLKQ